MNDAAFNVLGRDCSWRACALAVNVPPTSRRSISRPQASRANILPYGSGATLGTRLIYCLRSACHNAFAPTCLGFLVGRGFPANYRAYDLRPFRDVRATL